MKKSERGILLFEALLTTVVLSGGIVLVCGALASTLRLIRWSQEHTRAGYLLSEEAWRREKISLAAGDEAMPDSPLPQSTWEVFSEPGADEASDKFTLQLNWVARGRDESLSLEYLIPRKDPAEK